MERCILRIRVPFYVDQRNLFLVLHFRKLVDENCIDGFGPQGHKISRGTNKINPATSRQLVIIWTKHTECNGFRNNYRNY